MSQISGLYLYFIAVIGYVLTPVSCLRLQIAITHFDNRYISTLYGHPKNSHFTVQFVQVVNLNDVGGREWTVWPLQNIIVPSDHRYQYKHYR